MRGASVFFQVQGLGNEIEIEIEGEKERLSGVS